MKVNQENLKRLDTEYAGYIEGDKVDDFFEDFGINFAAGHWCAGDFADRFAGTGDNWRLADFCFAAIDTGYNGWFGEDQFTYRMDPVKAMVLSREIFANVMKKALKIYAAKADLEKAQATGDAGATIDVVKKHLV